MSFSTQTVHEVIGMSVSEVHKTQGTNYQCVTFFYKDKSTHQITVFYEPGVETMKPRTFVWPVVEGDYKKENFPKDYVL